MRAAIVLLLAGVLAGSAQSAGGPRVRILDRSPLALRGSGFGAHETVRLSVAVGPRSEFRFVRALGTGIFVSRFPGLVYDRCHGTLKVTAIGLRGHRTGFILQPLPCPAAADSAATGVLRK